MKIAIHYSKSNFSDLWISYCIENKVPYKIVNCYDSDIISQLEDCQGLLWHWTLNDYKAALIARELTLSLEKKRILVFPDVNTAWHYNDKVGQKYLLEAIDAPFVNTYVFYSRHDALKWLSNTSFPKVFKLRSGAGSINVSLVKNEQQARKLINKAFNRGFYHINRISRFKDKLCAFKRDKSYTTFRNAICGFARIFLPTEVERFSHNEKGYVYFQDFIPENHSDTRLVVIGNRCLGIKRYCRDNDFRASGSGKKSFDHNLIDQKCIEIAFKVAKKLNLQSVAFDFIKNNNDFQIIEMSYCFVSTQFPGFWDTDLNWHNQKVTPQFFMIEDFLNTIKGDGFILNQRPEPVYKFSQNSHPEYLAELLTPDFQ